MMFLQKLITVQTTVDNIEDLLLSRQPENLDNYSGSYFCK